MSGSDWPLYDAKNRFSALVETAKHQGPQVVTKHGRPAVVVIAAEEYARLSGMASAAAPRRFADHLLAMPGDDAAFERLRAEPRDLPS